MKARVVAIVPSFRRPELLTRTLASLRGQPIERVIVINNSSDAATARAASTASAPVTVLDYGCNLGTAGGIAAGLHALQQDPEATHAWILDDDACAEPGALAEMLTAAEVAGADAVAPLITDETGRVAWFPGPLPQPAWDVVRARPTPEEFVQRCGEQPLRWNWAIWASVVISRRAIDAVGYPRIELWSQFSDLDYTLRVTERFIGVLAPRAVCRHRPPPADDAALGPKLRAALQNGDYVSLRLRHGWRAVRHLPGNQLRFLKHHHWRPRAWSEVVVAFWQGAILGRPSGRTTQAEEVALAQSAWEQRVGPPDQGH